MTSAAEFWKLEHLSDVQLINALRALVQSEHGLNARLIAHLAEVEERRLHLKAVCSSLFDYCVTRLGLSEDAACRRIEVARLARRFPLVFRMLDRGELTLSVAAKLKPHISAENHVELLEAVRGKSVAQTVRKLAELFPQPDVPDAIRKLPAPAGRSPAAARHGADALLVVSGDASPDVEPPLLVTTQAQHTTRAPLLATPNDPALARTELAPPATGRMASTETPAMARVASTATATPASRTRQSVLEPLSPERYRVQFTASSELKRKLELARDLLRHAEPSGDLAAGVERAVDVLLTDLMKRRFGKTAKPRTAKARKARPERIPNATRRQVLDRDGLRCAWVDENGRRCSSRAFLEHDHVHPLGKGGGPNSSNIRLLCSAHNRFAAELAYGLEHIQTAIEQRRRARAVEPPLADTVDRGS